ncbi:MAG: adenosylmethionine decarboxylase [Deltaproteobacteria bacterium]|nr:MAG: adenosylmethionine decarboxylase [Deltaproteobacteria bacterium]
MSPLGSHIILEMYDCPPERLDDVACVLDALRTAAKRARSTLLAENHHRFDPQGVTAIALLAESHISIHTWPELGYAAADVFTCGAHTDPQAACEVLVAALGAGRHEQRNMPRGVLPPVRPVRLPRAAEG